MARPLRSRPVSWRSSSRVPLNQGCDRRAAAEPMQPTILALSFRCEGDPVWEDGLMLIYKIVLSSLNRQAGDKMHSSRLHAREGPTVPASLRPGPLSPCPSARLLSVRVLEPEPCHGPRCRYTYPVSLYL